MQISVKPRATDWSILFPDGGFIFLKNRDITLCISAICERQKEKRGHIHLDPGSITLSYKGFPVIADPGTCTYTRDFQIRKRYVSERYHNIISIQNTPMEYTEMPGFFGVTIQNRMKITNLRDDYIEYEHDYFAVKVTRSILLKENEIIVNDSGESGIVSYFHFHPGCRVMDKTIHSIGVKNEDIVMNINTNGDISTESYMYSAGYGLQERADRLVVQSKYSHNISFLFH